MRFGCTEIQGYSQVQMARDSHRRVGNGWWAGDEYGCGHIRDSGPILPLSEQGACLGWD